MPTAICPGTAGMGAGCSSSALSAVGSSPRSVESTWMYCRLACWSGGISAAVASTSVLRPQHLQVRREPVAVLVLGDRERLPLLLQDGLGRSEACRWAPRSSRYARAVSAATISTTPRRSAAAACSFARADSTPRRVPPNTSTTQEASKPTWNRLSSRSRPGRPIAASLPRNRRAEAPTLDLRIEQRLRHLPRRPRLAQARLGDGDAVVRRHRSLDEVRELRVAQLPPPPDLGRTPWRSTDAGAVVGPVGRLAVRRRHRRLRAACSSGRPCSRPPSDSAASDPGSAHRAALNLIFLVFIASAFVAV